MSRLAYLHPLQPRANSGMARLVSDAQGFSTFDGDAESGWVTLKHQPRGSGLHQQGRWQAQIEVASKASMLLIAQFLPMEIEVDARQDVQAIRSDSAWIDVHLRQFAPTHPTLCGLSMIEISAKNVVAGQVKVLRSVKASPIPMEMISMFTLGFRLRFGKMAVEICSESDQLSVTRIDLERFGEVLPWIRLRNGKQPLDSGISRASFRQKVSWSM